MELVMKRLIAATAVTMVSTNAFAVTAHFTGHRESGWSATREPMIMCEYEAEGRRFWQTFKAGRCPKTVEVETKTEPSEKSN